MMKRLTKLRFSTHRCMPIHPVLISSSHQKVNENDRYNCLEGLRLVEALGWDIIPGPFLDNTFQKFLIKNEDKQVEVDENNLPNNLENGDKVNLFGQPAVFQGDKCFELLSTKISEAELAAQSPALRPKRHLVKIKAPSGLTMLPRSLLKDLSDCLKTQKIGILFINSFLTALQQRNLKTTLEKYSGYKELVVLDRLGLILEIFNRRSTSDLTKMQVALAYLKYSKALFTRENNYFTKIADIMHFDVTKPDMMKVQIASAKQSGRKYAVGGEGESEKEQQRRITNKLETVIKKRIEKAEEQMKKTATTTAKHRNLATVALIGYTNSGKSAVLNLLGKNQMVSSKDRLFETLKTVTRRVHLRGNFETLFIDTIGFVSDLPHELVPTFVSTLDHLKTADLLLHIRDISHPCTNKQLETVKETLSRIGLKEDELKGKIIEVRNKVDLLFEENEDSKAITKYKETDDIIYISATKGYNLEKFANKVKNKIYQHFGCYLLTFRHDQSRHSEIVNWLREYYK